jgi:hypothetical protein
MTLLRVRMPKRCGRMVWEFVCRQDLPDAYLRAQRGFGQVPLLVFHEEVEQGSRPQVEGEESAHGVTTVFPLRGLVEEVVASCQAKKSGGELLARASRYLCHFCRWWPIHQKIIAWDGGFLWCVCSSSRGSRGSSHPLGAMNSSIWHPVFMSFYNQNMWTMLNHHKQIYTNIIKYRFKFIFCPLSGPQECELFAPRTSRRSRASCQAVNELFDTSPTKAWPSNDAEWFWMEMETSHFWCLMPLFLVVVHIVHQ